MYCKVECEYESTPFNMETAAGGYGSREDYFDSYYYCPKGFEKYTGIDNYDDSSDNNDSNDSKDKKLSAGAIAGISIACVAVVAAIVVVLVCMFCKKKTASSSQGRPGS